MTAPLPLPFHEPIPLNARLVTKTSLPEPKKAIALLIILWYANGKADTIEYGKMAGKDGTLLDDAIADSVDEYRHCHNVDLGDKGIAALLEENPLFKSQIEALNSAFELVWHLASFEFADSALGRTAERKKTDDKVIRYRKRICYSTNLDLIDLVAACDQDLFARVLFNWLSDGAIVGDEATENRLVHMLSVFVESSFFKTGKGDKGVVFVPSGVYDALLNGEETVDIVDLEEEAQGATRILRSAIRSGLNPMLTILNNSARKADGVSDEELRAFSNRAKTGIILSNVKVDIKGKANKDDKSSPDLADIEEPRNLIFFGAPGTGKSYQLNKLAKENFADTNMRRVTFYPDYTYAQFMGSYKPFPMFDEYSKPTGKITYDFVPGPFLQSYVQAVQNPEMNYLLIIEEINRANPAAVFGDLFQLLDRNSSGRSEYDIAVPPEMQLYFEIRIPEYHTNNKRSNPLEGLEEGIRLSDETMRISLPPNLYIWATMNSADQGVFPMDTAFKRRWDFRYIGINDGENAVLPDGRILSEVVVEVAGKRIVWNNLRHEINELMANRDNKINEDKLLGPFFLSPQTLDDECFANAFKDKVLLYLYEDAGKMKRKGLFRDESATYSELCEQVEENCVELFKDIAFESVAAGAQDGETTEEPEE